MIESNSLMEYILFQTPELKKIIQAISEKRKA
jgi:hypothetical protein